MEIKTSRFGPLEVAPGDVLAFPAGLPGLEECVSWVLLADAHNGSLGWLQSTTQAETALAVVSPRRFVPDYALRVTRSELGSPWSEHLDEVLVLSIVSKNERGITLNLKAPLVVYLPGRVGRQVIACGDQPLQYELGRQRVPLKKSA